MAPPAWGVEVQVALAGRAALAALARPTALAAWAGGAALDILAATESWQLWQL